MEGSDPVQSIASCSTHLTPVSCVAEVYPIKNQGKSFRMVLFGKGYMMHIQQLNVSAAHSHPRRLTSEKRMDDDLKDLTRRSCW